MPDIFDDLDALQVPADELLTTTRTSTIEARRPRKGEWFRVDGRHPPATFRLYVETRRDNPKTYLVAGQAAADRVIQGIAKPRVLYVASNRFGEAFLSLVGAGDDDWSVTSRKGHLQAVKAWVMLVPNRAVGSYDLTVADFQEPATFPDCSLSDMLRMAFRDRVIDRLDHPVALELLGKTAP